MIVDLITQHKLFVGSIFQAVQLLTQPPHLLKIEILYMTY